MPHDNTNRGAIWKNEKKERTRILTSPGIAQRRWRRVLGFRMEAEGRRFAEIPGSFVLGEAEGTLALKSKLNPLTRPEQGPT
jgi:hypothetical protein